MKKITTLIFISFIFHHYVTAQLVSDQTGSVSIDLRKDINTVMPEIEWIYPRTEYNNSQENKIMIHARITSQKPLGKVELILTSAVDSSQYANKEFDVADNIFELEINTNIHLQEGENIIKIYATNQEGGMISDFRSVIIGLDAITDAVAIDRRDYALLFATDKYDQWTDLVNPVFDARTIAAELEERYGFEVEIVENASQDEVFIKLREYSQKKYKPQDQLMIFFAGHGQYDETFGEGFVVARNSARNDPGKTSYISHNRLRNNIDNISCNHIFLLMDVCFGGTFDPQLAGARSSVYEETNRNDYLVKKLSFRTRKYLTSGSKEYVSDGIMGQHSPFALKFIESLKTNGGEDRILILEEIRLFMEKLKTTPRFDGFGTDELSSDFVFVAR